jgi:hypothetical protein
MRCPQPYHVISPVQGFEEGMQDTWLCALPLESWQRLPRELSSTLHSLHMDLRRLTGIPKDASGLSLRAAVLEWSRPGNSLPENLKGDPALIRQYRQYISGTLDRDRNEIRLLKLDCTRMKSEPLFGSLQHVSFEDAPPNDALSYTWEGKPGLQVIVLEGKGLPVTKNLFEALHRLRSRSECDHVYIWIDAICINQSNFLERNHQVGQMWHIYARAECVKIWLGETREESSLAFALADDLVAAAALQNVGELFTEPERLQQLVAFQELLHREYWNRIWVIQEVNAAKKVEVMQYHGTISSRHRMQLYRIARRVGDW